MNNDQIILRGCRLRNTKWCYGIVIFAGRDTKLMQNSGQSKLKRTSIDRMVNKLVLVVRIIFFFLLLIILILLLFVGRGMGLGGGMDLFLL